MLSRKVASETAQSKWKFKWVDTFSQNSPISYLIKIRLSILDLFE
jgi:hypothetical protein